MRVKIGDQWFAVAAGQPIMIELTPGDRQNITNMAPDATRYALFPEVEPRMTREEKEAWMDEGAGGPDLEATPAP